MSLIYENPLKIEFSDDKLIVNGKQHPYTTRKLSEMKDVLMKDVKTDEDIDMYHMFREVYVKDDLRYDITHVPARVTGGEFAKTYGHCHPVAEKGLTYPEVYQVLMGKALFILQKELENLRYIVSIVDASEGDVLLIPPNFCHVSINPSEKNLLLANIVSTKFQSLYEKFRENRGAAYYYSEDRELVQNSNYVVEKNERVAPAEINRRYNFSSDDLLKELYENPEKFEFMNRPSILKS
jgi:glucose-6-phosphate isomerase